MGNSNSREKSLKLLTYNKISYHNIVEDAFISVLLLNVIDIEKKMNSKTH